MSSSPPGSFSLERAATLALERAMMSISSSRLVAPVTCMREKASCKQIQRTINGRHHQGDLAGHGLRQNTPS